MHERALTKGARHLVVAELDLAKQRAAQGAALRQQGKRKMISKRFENGLRSDVSRTQSWTRLGQRNAASKQTRPKCSSRNNGNARCKTKDKETATRKQRFPVVKTCISDNTQEGKHLQSSIGRWDVRLTWLRGSDGNQSKQLHSRCRG